MLRDGSLSVVYQRPGRKTSLGRSDYQGHRFDLRFLRPFRADLSIRKSSSFFPPLIASTSQRGLAPRPAQVSPDGLRYFGGTFLPLNALPPPRPRRTLSPPTNAILSNCFCNSTRCSTSISSTRLRRFISDSTSIRERFGFGIVALQKKLREFALRSLSAQCHSMHNPPVCNALPYGVLEVYDLHVIIRPGNIDVGSLWRTFS